MIILEQWFVNPVSEFLARNLVAVCFLYGLAFFAMGLVLFITGRRVSQLRFVKAIRPLAVFGILHGLHEWIEMFQMIASQAGERSPPPIEEAFRLVVLAASFLMLMIFAVQLLLPERVSSHRAWLLTGGAGGLWALSTAGAAIIFRTSVVDSIPLADVLARYTLGIPAALLGAWALMAQQRAFRELGVERFGRDLVWCATALLLYGAIGQVFVRPSVLPPSTVVNSNLFFQWFGIPVQLFRGLMACVLVIYMARVLNVFEEESRRRLEEALEREGRIADAMEHLNEELRLKARELSLLLDLSNLLAAPMRLEESLRSVIEKSLDRLSFPSAGIISLVRRTDRSVYVASAVGFEMHGDDWLCTAFELGERSAASGLVVCLHLDGTIFEYSVQEALRREECRRHLSPASVISFPLIVREEVIGSITFARVDGTGAPLPLDEYELMVATAQQLALSIENARLRQQSQEREKTLGELLHQVVNAQERERQRIARDLHDVTGQSLTAITLGLRGVETTMGGDPRLASEQIRELKSFSTVALDDLRQLIADLRPSQLDDLGLVAALQWYVQEFEQRHDIETALSVSGNHAQKIPPEHEIVLFRITQEALSNAARHSGASLVAVRLDLGPAQISLSVEDNGGGFDVNEVISKTDKTGTRGWGLLGIQERATLVGGHCEIYSHPGRGTRIRVTVPLVDESEVLAGHDNTGGVGG